MSSNKKIVSNSSKNEEISKSDIWSEIFKSKIRFRILQLLFVYGELSLTELSLQMKKSKPALYHHLQKMISLDLIKVSKEEHIRGSIKAKFYSLDKQTAITIQLFSEEELKKIDNPNKRLKTLKTIIDNYRSSISLFRNKMDLLDLYTVLLEEETQSNKDPNSISLDLIRLISEYDIGFHAQYLTEKQYTKFMEYYQEFYEKISKMIISDGSRENQKNEKIEEHPYFIMMMTIPLKKLLELEFEKMETLRS